MITSVCQTCTVEGAGTARADDRAELLQNVTTSAGTCVHDQRKAPSERGDQERKRREPERGQPRPRKRDRHE